MQSRAAEIAAAGVYLGTSNWKYEGWRGQLYSADRYEYHGKLAKIGDERDCLGEYAEVFKPVCVDTVYYSRATTSRWEVATAARFATLAANGPVSRVAINCALVTRRLPAQAGR